MNFSSMKFTPLNVHSPGKKSIINKIRNVDFYDAHIDIKSIRNPGKKMTVWQRKLPNHVTHFLNSLCLPMLRQEQFVWHADQDLTPMLDKAIASFSTSHCSGHMAWREDMQFLLQQCRELSPMHPIKVRLESVSNNGCRLFHTDKVALRMLCTYRGEGTLWIPEHAIDRWQKDRINNSHVKDSTAIAALDTGWVAYLKGDAYPGELDEGIFHRSPTAGTDMPRILLAADLH
jgi:Protein of unknown function (DUF1826)